jgi:lysophospholipase L1-like esterase
MSLPRFLLIVYVAALHAAIAVAIFAPAQFGSILAHLRAAPRSSFYQERLADHLLGDGAVPQGAVIFIGDSQIQSLDVEGVARGAVNFGIGGDTTAGVLQRLPLYASLGRARAVVLEIGTNDLAVTTAPQEIVANYQRILSSIPREAAVVVNAVLPVSAGKSGESGSPVSRNRAIGEINRGLAAICATRAGCAFIDPGPALADPSGDLAAEYDLGDGLHLSRAGYRVWSDMLRAALARDAG